MHALLSHLLTADPTPQAVDTLEGWWRGHTRRASTWSSPFDGAVVSALVADRLGYAFAAGYQAAVRALLPALPSAHLVGLSATEAGGAHPRAIETSLQEHGQAWRLNGKKSWATLAPLAEELLVVAKVGVDADGRNRLRVVRMSTRARGVHIEPMPATPFAPEIPHAEVELCDVVVEDEQLLEGDGYTDYLKPFRTIEDIHVHAALIGYLLGVARRSGFSTSTVEALLEQLVALRGLSQQPPADPAVHVALAGVLRHSRELLAANGEAWEGVDPAERERWQRDQGLLEVAARARSARVEAAWRRLREESGAFAPR